MLYRLTVLFSNGMSCLRKRANFCRRHGPKWRRRTTSFLCLPLISIQTHAVYCASFGIWRAVQMGCSLSSMSLVNCSFTRHRTKSLLCVCVCVCVCVKYALYVLIRFIVYCAQAYGALFKWDVLFEGMRELSVSLFFLHFIFHVFALHPMPTTDSLGLTAVYVSNLCV